MQINFLEVLSVPVCKVNLYYRNLYTHLIDIAQINN